MLLFINYWGGEVSAETPDTVEDTLADTVADIVADTAADIVADTAAVSCQNVGSTGGATLVQTVVNFSKLLDVKCS